PGAARGPAPGRAAHSRAAGRASAASSSAELSPGGIAARLRLHGRVRRFELDLIDFFYDISIPAEIREATQAGLESDTCMVTLSYAAAADADVAPWLATELVQRWHAGRVKSLLVLVKLASEYGVEFDNVLPNDPRAVCWEELLAQEELPDLGAARRRTQT